MVKVRGASYRPLFLPEINDTVFFGQIKTYQTSHMDKSPTLREALASGKLIILESTDTVPVPVPQTTAPVDQPTLSAASVSPEPGQAQTDKMPARAEALLASLVERVEGLSKDLAQSRDRDSLLPGISPDISEKLEAIASKLEGIRVSGPGVQEPMVSTMSTRASGQGGSDEMFIPSTIRVDDLTNNITLEPRSLGQGGSVNEAAAALKKAMKQSASADIK